MSTIKKFILHELNSVIDKLDKFTSGNCFTSLYGIARSFIAFGLLATFMFNQTNILFDEHLFNVGTEGRFVDSINFFYLFEYKQLWLAEIFAAIVLIIVISGFFPRLTGILHWWVAFSFNNAASIVDGGDQIASVLVFMLIPVTLLDNRKNHFFIPVTQYWLSKMVGNFFLRVIIPIQMAIVYYHAAIGKLYALEEWRNGTAVYYFTQDPIFGSDLLSILSATNFVLLFTWGTILLEFVLGGCLFMSYSLKRYFLPLAFFFHLSIAFSFGLFSFMFSMLGGLCIYLLNPVKFNQ